MCCFPQIDLNYEDRFYFNSQIDKCLLIEKWDTTIQSKELIMDKIVRIGCENTKYNYSMFKLDKEIIFKEAKIRKKERNFLVETKN